MKLVTTVYRRVDVVARDLDATLPAVPAVAPGRVRLLGAADLAAWRAFRPNVPAAVVQARLARGERGFAVEWAGRLVHATWSDSGQPYVPYLRRALALAPTDCYLHDAWTAPAHRGRGLAPAAYATLLRHERDAGFARCLAVVAVENAAGRRVMDKLGFATIGRYGCWRLGPWQWTWQQAAAGRTLPALVPAPRREREG